MAIKCDFCRYHDAIEDAKDMKMKVVERKSMIPALQLEVLLVPRKKKFKDPMELEDHLIYATFNCSKEELPTRCICASVA